jgi:hypothetical protein
MEKFDTFATTKPHHESSDKDTPLSINPETGPGPKTLESRRVEFNFDEKQKKTAEKNLSTFSPLVSLSFPFHRFGFNRGILPSLLLSFLLSQRLSLGASHTQINHHTEIVRIEN